MLSGGRLIAYQGDDQLRWLIRLAFLMLLGSRINECILSLPSGYLVARREIHANVWMSPCKPRSARLAPSNFIEILASPPLPLPLPLPLPPLRKTDFRPDQAVTIIRSFLLPRWLGGRVTGFASSGSMNSDVAERNRRLRAPLMRRLFVIGWNGGVLGHFLYMVVVMAAVASSVSQAFNTSMPNSTSQEEDVRWIFILTHAGWPPILWIYMTCLSACAVPILNIFRPPSVPEREKLLVRSQDTGVAYPKQDADAERSPQWSTMDCIQELMYTLVTIYTTGIFVASWVK